MKYQIVRIFGLPGNRPWPGDVSPAFAMICQYLSSPVQVLVTSACSPQRRLILRRFCHLHEKATSKDNGLASGDRADSACRCREEDSGKWAYLFEITIGAVSRIRTLWVLRDVLASLSLLRYTPFGLLNTFFLCRVSHSQFTEPVHQLTIGWVKLQGTKPGLTGF